MKSQTTKKLFAFIITTILFSCLTQFAAAQKTKTYSCSCFARGYGCPKLNSACVGFCIAQCGRVIETKNLINVIALKDTLHSQSNFTPIAILQFDNSSKLLESKKSLLTLKNNSQTQFIKQMEWGSADAINSTSN